MSDLVPDHQKREVDQASAAMAIPPNHAAPDSAVDTAVVSRAIEASVARALSRSPDCTASNLSARATESAPPLGRSVQAEAERPQPARPDAYAGGAPPTPLLPKTGSAAVSTSPAMATAAVAVAEGTLQQSGHLVKLEPGWGTTQRLRSGAVLAVVSVILGLVLAAVVGLSVAALVVTLDHAVNSSTTVH